jgi:hypothetical protein
MANIQEERQTGDKALLKFNPGGGETFEIQFSNVSWSRDIGTTEVQHNDSLKPTIATTDVRFSGSFEYQGTNFDAINKLLYGVDVQQDDRIVRESSEPVRGTLTVKETVEDGTEVLDEYTYIFKGCVVTSNSRDIPSDDVTSTSYDWVAEDLLILGSGNIPPGAP